LRLKITGRSILVRIKKYRTKLVLCARYVVIKLLFFNALRKTLAWHVLCCKVNHSSDKCPKRAPQWCAAHFASLKPTNRLTQTTTPPTGDQHDSRKCTKNGERQRNQVR
jgi:hypothetical protein